MSKFILGTPVDVQGNTYVGYTGKGWHRSVALTKAEGLEFKASGRLPESVADKFLEMGSREKRHG